jgi:hypothetical protein
MTLCAAEPAAADLKEDACSSDVHPVDTGVDPSKRAGLDRPVILPADQAARDEAETADLYAHWLA